MLAASARDLGFRRGFRRGLTRGAIFRLDSVPVPVACRLDDRSRLDGPTHAIWRLHTLGQRLRG
jgi:hypothetical protein